MITVKIDLKKLDKNTSSMAATEPNTSTSFFSRTAMVPTNTAMTMW